MIAWAYVRVSGDAQADRGLPVAGQKEAAERYAQENELLLERIFTDEARVGSSDERPEFQRMMHLAHLTPRRVDIILLWSWSRFSRDQNDAHFWKASLRRHGVEIVDISGETPRAGANGFEYVLESLVHWKDEQRLAEISHDSKRGQQTIARAGYIPSGCLPPRGYQVQFETKEFEGRKRQLRRWVPDPALWPVARKAWDMRLAGHSYKEILAATGLYRTPYCLATFFANTAYRGEVTFGGTPIPVEPLVTVDEWNQVNAGRAKRRGGAYPRRQGSRFLLSGLLTCARCGSALAGNSSPSSVRNDGYTRQRWDHYICLKHKQGACDLPRIAARAIDNAITTLVLREILTPEALAAQIAHIRAQLDQERPALEARLTDLQRTLATTDAAITHLVDALETAASSPALAARLTQRELERADLIHQIANIRGEITARQPDGAHIETLRQALTAALTTRQIQPARTLLRTLITEIIVNESEATVHYRLPFPTVIQ